MSSHAIEAGAVAGDTGRSAVWPRDPSAAVAVLLALVAIAVQSLWIPIDADVSWLITVSERVLAGDRLYVDILEVNPPASVWLYLPLVWLADLSGTRPEAVVVAAFIAAGLLSVLVTLRLASRLDDAPRPLILSAVVSFACLVLPMALFAQREHAALLLAFPSLTSLAVIAEGKRLSKRALCASGLAAGLVIVIKPHFLLAIAVPAVWVAFKRRSLAPLVPGIAAALLAVALYGAALIVFARSYLDWLPVIASTYGPMHEVWWKVAVGPALYPAICVALALLLRPPHVPAIAMSWMLGGAGFLIAAYAQAKNYPNHWLPQAALALSAAFAIVPFSPASIGRRAIIVSGLVVVALCEMQRWAILPDAGIESAIRRSAPPEPRVIALSPQLATGHPVTRNVGGTWVGSRAGLFTASGARFVGLGNPVAHEAYREDIAAFARDVERHAPDVVLVHRPSKAWLMSEPAIVGAMRDYSPAASSNDTEVWVRRPQR